MIEKLAKAAAEGLHLWDCLDDQPAFDGDLGVSKQTYRDAVVRVLTALREPDRGVIEALEDLLESQGYHQTIEESWNILIDATLAEDEKARHHV